MYHAPVIICLLILLDWCCYAWFVVRCYVLWYSLFYVSFSFYLPSFLQHLLITSIWYDIVVYLVFLSSVYRVQCLVLATSSFMFNFRGLTCMSLGVLFVVSLSYFWFMSGHLFSMVYLPIIDEPSFIIQHSLVILMVQFLVYMTYCVLLVVRCSVCFTVIPCISQ